MVGKIELHPPLTELVSALVSPTMPTVITDLVLDVIVIIAMFGGLEVFHHLAITNRKFARMLGNRAIQARAKSAFARRHTFVQSAAPFYAVVADLLPNGWRHGLVQLYDNNTGKIAASAEFVNNHRHGTEERYDAAGQLTRRTTYCKGNRRGLDTRLVNGKVLEEFFWNDNDTMISHVCYGVNGHKLRVQFYVNGHLRKQLIYIDGKLRRIELFKPAPPIPGKNNGINKHNRPFLKQREPTGVKGNPASRKAFRLNVPIADTNRTIYDYLNLHGKQVEFYPNGHLQLIKTYQNGQLNGKTTAYTEEGKLDRVIEYAHGKHHGPMIIYHPNDTPRMVRQYSHDVPTGKWLHCYEDGSPESEREYDERGRATGKCTEYRRDGSIAVVSEYSRGEIEQRTEYNPDGSVAAVSMYENDTIAKRTEYNSAGKIVVWEKYQDGCVSNRHEIDHQRGTVVAKRYCVKSGDILEQKTIDHNKTTRDDPA